MDSTICSKVVTMYCSNCGSKAQGNFCSNCGVKLQSAAPVESDSPIFDDEDWSCEVNYKKLVQHPEVREMLTMAGNRAKTRMTGEQLLEKFENIVPGVSIAAAAAQPLYAYLGAKSGKAVSRQFNLPAGQVLVTILCALAEGGNKLRNVQQIQDGCRLEASIPSDIWSFEGILHVQVQRAGVRTIVEAATQIPGQFFDWGKSQRLLDHLIGDIGKKAA